MHRSIMCLSVLALVVPLSTLRAQDSLAADTVFHPGKVDELPEPVRGSCRAASWPRAVKDPVTSGRVVFDVVIDKSGRFEPASFVVVSATDDAFVEPAKKSFMTCRFRAAQRGGLAVRVRVRQTMNFAKGR